MSRRFISLIITVMLLMITGTPRVFAGEVDHNREVSPSDSDVEIVDSIKENGRIDNHDLTAHKLSSDELKNAITVDKELNLTNVNAYRIERKYGGYNTVTVVAEMDTPTYRGNGYVEDDKDGRVAISAFLRYDTRTFKSYKCGKGVKYGGRVLYKQSAASVTKLQGKYNESGAAYTSSGSSTMANYTNNANFSTSNLYGSKSKSINRSLYVCLENGTGFLRSSFTATYKLSGKTYNITVSVNAS